MSRVKKIRRVASVCPGVPVPEFPFLWELLDSADAERLGSGFLSSSSFVFNAGYQLSIDFTTNLTGIHA